MPRTCSTFRCAVPVSDPSFETINDINTMAAATHALFGVFTFDQVQIIWERIVLLHSLGNFQVAIDCCRPLVSQTNNTLIKAILTLNSGIMSSQLGQHEQAGRSFDEAISLEPGLCIAHFLLGITAYRRNQYKKAMDAFAQCRMLFSKNCQTINYHNLGLDYVLQLNLVVENEVSSMLEWSQTQMASNGQELSPRSVHTIEANLIFKSPSLTFISQRLDLLSENSVGSPKISIGPTNGLSENCSTHPTTCLLYTSPSPRD